MKLPILCLVAVLMFDCKNDTSTLSTTTESLNNETLTSNKSLVNTTKSPYAKLQAVGFDDVTLTDGFWAERVNTCLNTMIPEMWRIYSDPEMSHALRNFEIAAGLEEGNHEGAPFHDGDFYKLIEAASMAYAITKDEKFDKMIDDVIPLIRDSQREDGYIHTPVMINAKNNPETAQEFRDRMDFESYNMGHLMTAATVHYKATGKTDLLEIAKKAADYLYTYTERFPEKMAQNAICPSHYMGVIEMYRTTNNPKYLKLAKEFIDIRSLMKEGTDHNQDRIPFREQTKAVGHAVRANYLYAGVADVYAETGDETLKTALDKIWDDLVTTKLYITGGCGALYDGVSPNGTSYSPPEIQQVHQAYGREYELPNAGAHNETCANIGSALWNWRMLQTTAEAKYADLLEHTLYNSVLSGVNLNGKGYFYTNPLSNQMDLPFDLRWPNVREEYISLSNCCPPNTIRTIAEVENYLYSKNETGIWLNMYSSSTLSTQIGEDKIRLTQTTNYPWEGTVKIKIDEAPASSKSLSFRSPDWCKSATLFVNGEKVQSSKASSSYLTVDQQWKAGDEITFTMDMPAKLIEANPLVEETRNQVAVTRGPLVYCLEANDLGPGLKLANVVIPANIKLTPEKTTIGTSQVMSLKGTGQIISNEWNGRLYQELNTKATTTEVRLIPYFAWANRDEADMAVWLPLGR
ncbi:MAG: glycoside hydrolase family 127 protein [Cyclobacteriaceae bacterium]